MTSPRGFAAGGAYANIRNYGPEPRRDVGLLAADRPCTAAGVFTKNRVCGAPVQISRQHIADGAAQAIAVNSGCSNVAMGESGLRDARQMAEAAGQRLGLEATSVLIASTGVIARPMPMAKLLAGIASVSPSADGGSDFCRAMMTTDRVPKHRALKFSVAGRVYTLGGAAKGSGMARPDMATVLCFLTTDAPLEHAFAQSVLAEVADSSLNMLNIDLDTSTSDTMLLLANGAAGGPPLGERQGGTEARAALTQLCKELTRDLARDGEGARTMIQVDVLGAASLRDARLAAHTIVSSPLVKTMVTGRDPNIGRVLMAAGRSGAELDVSRITVTINGFTGYGDGRFQVENEKPLKRAMDASEVVIAVDLGVGRERATAWGCDLTDEYVYINADYTT